MQRSNSSESAGTSAVRRIRPGSAFHLLLIPQPHPLRGQGYFWASLHAVITAATVNPASAPL